MNKETFHQYKRIKNRINHYLFLGIEPGTLGNLVSDWTQLDRSTAYKWVSLTQEAQQERLRVFGSVVLLLLWTGGFGVGYLLLVLLGMIPQPNRMSFELFAVFIGVIFWLGTMGSFILSRLRFKLL